MEALAFDLSISRRTLYRDLTALREAGCVVNFNARSQMQCVPRQRERGQLPVDENRLAALALAAHLSPLNKVHGFSSLIRLAISEISHGLTDRAKSSLYQTLNSCVVTSNEFGNGVREMEVLEIILLAIGKRQKVRLTLKWDDALTWDDRSFLKTKFAPYRLEIDNHCSCIVGRSSVHRKVRRFALTNISHVEILEEPYVVPIAFNSKLAS